MASIVAVPTRATNLRLTPADRANAQEIIEAGMASDVTGAVRVALALVAKRLVRGKRKSKRTG